MRTKGVDYQEDVQNTSPTVEKLLPEKSVNVV